MEKFIFLVVLMFYCVKADRIYHGECPDVTPMPDFDMERFLGVWYQVQPGEDPTEQQNEQEYPSCEFYTVKHTNSPSRFVVNTEFDLYTDFVDGKPLQYESFSTNYLDTLDEPARMSFTPPVLTGGQVIESNFTIFATDYTSYAIISNCDKEMNGDDVQFTQHATLWSRTRHLDNDFLDNLYSHVGTFEFDPYNLSSVNQTGCIEGGRRLGSINLDEQNLTES